MNSRFRRFWALSIVRGSLLMAASALLNCTCMDHPLYRAGVNRWDGAYMGGGNSQVRPFASGIRSAHFPEPAILELSCSVQGLSLQIWVREDIDASVIKLFSPSTGSEAARALHSLDAQTSARFIVSYDEIDERLEAQSDFRVELEDGAGTITSIVVTPDDVLSTLDHCDAEAEPSAVEGKGG